ncbi:MAG: hypothetical protein II038_06675 [Lachnospiraceae bacterium]|nr:hypothetical protein [Lachnospiraceae bacterium]
MKTNPIKRVSGLIKVRGGFSDKQGISPYNTALQTTEFDDETRMALSNKLFEALVMVFEGERLVGPYHHYIDGERYTEPFCVAVLNDVFHQSTAIDRGYHHNWRAVYDNIHRVILSAIYNEVLDVIGYCVSWLSHTCSLKEELYQSFNELFEKEHIGYRFLFGQIVPITDEQELGTVKEACRNPIEGCRKQLQKAVAFLSDREHPDYKNCIKESISAVESICQVIVGDEKATLGDALKQLEKRGLSIHPCLKTAFSKLYGYTTDQGGIRHAEGMFESNVTFEEAKFILVSCSAFINYLIAEYGKRGN